MTEARLETCADCGTALPPVDAPGHHYFGASPSCWALYGEILAREYSGPRYMEVHQLTVDAYAAQHPGAAGPRAQRSVWGHLASLYVQLEKDEPEAVARRMIARVAAMADELGWLEPPERKGDVTVGDVIAASGADEHHAAVRVWARAVWEAWGGHRDRVIAAVERAQSQR